MPATLLYFKVHQPYRLRKYGNTDIDALHNYVDEPATVAALDRVAEQCYLPANAILLDLLNENKEDFKFSFSISGITLELLEKYRPDVLSAFQQLVKTGQVEILAETYYNSLCWLYSKKEFERQLKLHAAIVKRLFGIEPTVFRNTELIYSNELAAFMQSMGYKAILCEGLQRILNGRSPNHVYTVPGLEYIRLLLRNVNLSDDIAFRFGESRWSEYPLTAEKFAGWVHKQAADSTTINIFIDYETFGLHKKTETGIMQFLRQLPEALFLKDGMYFSTPSSIINTVTQAAPYDVPETISWEDRSKENCVYCETMHQNNALHKLYGLEKIVKAYEEEDVLKQWGLLQCADYLYYMNDDKMDYEAHPYRQNPFSCKEEAYRNFINILTDFEISLIKRGLIKIKQPIQDIHIY